MSTTKQFPFDRARRITAKEVGGYKRAIEKITGHKRRVRGRPRKILGEKYLTISIRLHPKVVMWAKMQAAIKGIGYQTIINETLLRKVA